MDESAGVLFSTAAVFVRVSPVVPFEETKYDLVLRATAAEGRSSFGSV